MLLAALRHDRALVLAGLLAVIVLAWAWLLLGAGIEMERMDMGGGRVMLMAPAWTVGYAALVFSMWAIMMAAMMLPGAAPTILLVAALAGQRGTGGVRSTGFFALGYLLVWSGFSLLATLLQWGLDRAGLLSETMAAGSARFAGVLLIAAGIYQWTALKQACLIHCRSPLDHVTRYWRQGLLGPARAGARHGAFCLGCCWMLMALLFVGGLMNVLWIAALALLVLIEKLLPAGARVSRVTGGVLVVWGVGAILLGG